VRIELQVDGTAAEISSLRGWLVADPDVRAGVSLQASEGGAEPGQMGSVVDVMELVTGNGWSAASFVLALAAWRRTRPRSPRLEIRRGDTVIVLTDCSDQEIQQAVRALEESGEARNA
jgi:hypothetical protein